MIHTDDQRMHACIIKYLTFKTIPNLLIIELGKADIFWLNSFPVVNGIAGGMSPRMIMTGQIIDYKKHCKFQFGQYVLTHKGHDNSMNPQTIGAIVLQPTGNTQGSSYFLSISTGCVINHLFATPLPMPEEVIDAINHLENRQQVHPGLVLTDRRMVPDNGEDDDDSDDEEYEPVEGEDSDDEV